DRLNIPKGTAYRLVKKFNVNPDYKERINIKKNCPIKPIWNYVSAYWLYETVLFLANSLSKIHNINKHEFIDYLLDFAYTRDLSDKINPQNYLYVCMQRKINDYLRLYEYKNKRTLNNNNIYGGKDYGKDRNNF
ncbi:MAG: hypothetical protein ACP6IQ_11245, partial [Candidatus Njordarchaeia archaeon]